MKIYLANIVVVFMLQSIVLFTVKLLELISNFLPKIGLKFLFWVIVFITVCVCFNAFIQMFCTVQKWCFLYFGDVGIKANLPF